MKRERCPLEGTAEKDSLALSHTREESVYQSVSFIKFIAHLQLQGVFRLITYSGPAGSFNHDE